MNFEFRETPFSICLSIRKSFNNHLKAQPNQTVDFQDYSLYATTELERKLEVVKSEVHALKVRTSYLVEANDNLANIYGEEVVAAEQNQHELKDAIEEISNLKVNSEEIESNLSKLKKEQN